MFSMLCAPLKEMEGSISVQFEHPSTRKVRVFLPSSEERQVHDGSEGVNKLKDEGLEDEPILKALVCLWDL